MCNKSVQQQSNPIQWLIHIPFIHFKRQNGAQAQDNLDDKKKNENKNTSQPFFNKFKIKRKWFKCIDKDIGSTWYMHFIQSNMKVTFYQAQF